MKTIAWKTFNTIDFIAADGNIVACMELPRSIPMPTYNPGTLLSWIDRHEVRTYRVTDKPPHYHYSAESCTVEVYVESVEEGEQLKTSASVEF